MKIFVPEDLLCHNYDFGYDNNCPMGLYYLEKDGSKKLVQVWQMRGSYKPGEMSITEINEKNYHIRNDFFDRVARFFYCACYNSFNTDTDGWLPKDFKCYDENYLISLKYDTFLADLEYKYQRDEDIKSSDFYVYISHGFFEPNYAFFTLRVIAKLVGLDFEWDMSDEKCIKLTGRDPEVKSLKQLSLTNCIKNNLINEETKTLIPVEIYEDFEKEVKSTTSNEFILVPAHPVELGLVKCYDSDYYDSDDYSTDEEDEEI